MQRLHAAEKLPGAGVTCFGRRMPDTNPSSGCAYALHHQVHFRDRRGPLLSREGIGLGLHRRAPGKPGPAGVAAEARSLHQRGPRDDEPLSTRRGVRHRRRGRDRPRPRALRAVHDRRHGQAQQLHDRQDLLLGHQQGAARATTWVGRCRSSRTSPTRSRTASGGWRTGSTSSSWRSAARWATSRACPSWKPSASSGPTSASDNVLYIHLTLVPYISTSGELKTKPTQHSVKELREHRHPARHPALPHRPLPVEGAQGQDRPVLQRGRRRRHHRQGRGLHLRGAARVPQRGA